MLNIKSLLKSFFKIFLRRRVILPLLILIQLILFILILRFFIFHAVWIFTVFQLLSIFSVLWIVSKDNNPSYKLAWVIAILSAPLMGGFFYLLYGNYHQTKVLQAVKNSQNTFLENTIDKNTQLISSLDLENPNLAMCAKYIAHTSQFSIYQNTTAEYLNMGEVKFAKMLEELEKAEKFIFLEYFIVEAGVMWDSILEILARKVHAGVEVRVMYDDAGCLMTLPYNYHKHLESIGIQVSVFNPLRPHLNMSMNYRDHRKICVIDGNVGICSGINLADEYINKRNRFGHWKDTGVVLYGDGVWNLTAMFLVVWETSTGNATENIDSYRPSKTYETDGYVQPFSDSPLDDHNVAEFSYMQMINRATKYLYIVTPYLILDNEMITALTIAAQSGVDVKILTPHIPDKWYVHMLSRSYYTPLLKAGVQIFEYTPGFVHAKMCVTDDNMAIVGTANMDYRSFYLHYECGVTFYNSSVCTKVRDDILTTLEISQPVTIDQLENIPLYKKLFTSFVRIFAPMM